MPKWHYQLGLALLRWGNPEAARRTLKSAVKLAPANALLHASLGRAYFELSAYGRAEQELRTALSIDPDSREARISFGRDVDPFRTPPRRRTRNRAAHAV